MTEVQQQIWLEPVVALQLGAHRTALGRWELRLVLRRADAVDWAQAELEHYQLLTTHEMLDVLDAVLEAALLPAELR